MKTINSAGIFSTTIHSTLGILFFSMSMLQISAVTFAQESSFSPPSFGKITQIKKKFSFHSDCTARRVHLTAQDPITRELGDTIYEEYLPENPRGTVLILPPTGGETPLERIYARDLCHQGMAGVVIKSWPHDTDTGLELDVHNKGFYRGIVAIRRVAHWTHMNRAGKIGILGTSIGALLANLELESDSSLSAGVMIVGGAPLAHVLAYSELKAVREQREKRMKKYGLTTSGEYEAFMSKHIQVDTLKKAPILKSKALLLYIGLTDKIVPTDSQLAFWRATGKPPGAQFKSGHVMTALKTYFLKSKEIVSFFKENLSEL